MTSSRRNSRARRPHRARSFRAARGRRPQKSRGDWLGYVLFAISALIVAAAFVFAYFVREQPYDELTLCAFDERPSAHVFVLIDRSDVIIGPDRIRTIVREAEQGLKLGDRLSIFQIDADGATITDADFDMCNPGRQDQANPLYENPRMIQRRYEREFEGRLALILATLDEPIEANSSPIVESLAELFRLAADNGAEAVRVIVVSDFLQNSSAIGSAYTSSLQLDSAVRLLSSATDRPTQIEAYVMRRDTLDTLQIEMQQAFWSVVFEEVGVAVAWR